MKKSQKIKTISLGDIEWVHIPHAEKDDVEGLRRKFHLHPVDLKETLPPLQRPKLVPRDEYLFMILLYPIYDAKTGIVTSTEIDFFISPKRLITVNGEAIKALGHLFNTVKTADSMSHLLHMLLSELLERSSPLLLQLSADIDSIEKRIFADYEKGLIQELLRVKTNVANMRKAFQGHKGVIRNLIKHSNDRFPIGHLEVYFERLVEQTKENWDLLEVEKETINALHEANMSLIDFRINEIMKTLTIFSVIVFPLTLIAAIFGMNSINMPFVNQPHGFWIILGLMGSGVLAMLVLFRKKGWI